ncbi:hypothetical protein OIU84_023060 [Salix udensis]|uniref:HMA domain-containing protein n=1 Tax=Salix udensis TaxID=889485 RepID=A0AAD6KQI0_9ROSI|nr:hypothetical protein OIU84_023060 [Salix udensis]
MDSALAFTAATLPLVTITKSRCYAAVWNAFPAPRRLSGPRPAAEEVAASSGAAAGAVDRDGGDAESNSVAGAVDAEEVSLLSPDVIILDVGGMTCGGCAASVKRILESQPQVSSASVNLATETAIVWPVSEAKNVPNWQKQLGEALAKHLTSCGFMSNLRVAGQGATEGDISM